MLRVKRNHVSMAVAVLVVVACGWIGNKYLSQSHAATTCTVSAKLVNSCRPWLGARAGSYPLPSGTADTPKNQILGHEQRIGRKVDIAHVYHTAGQALNSDDLYFINRADTYLFADWKPAGNWAAGGDPNNTTTTASINKMANSIKAIAPKKLFITVWHEPQNDVSGGSNNCPSGFNYRGNAGTPAQYRAMWQNVRNKFDAAGVTNVVWAVDYQSYEPLDCLINELYPGDSLVDWVVTNGYGNVNQDDYTKNIQHYYDFFTNNSTTSRNYLSKAWGIIEWNISGVSGTVGANYYKSAKAAIDNNTFPKLKMHVVFDSIGPDQKDYRVAYDNTGSISPIKRDAYTAYANDPRFTDAFYEGSTTPPPPPPPPTDTTPPTVSIASPANGATISGTTTITGTASDNVGVTAVNLRVDDKYVSSDSSSPFSFTLDTTGYSDGTHTITLRAMDAANNQTDKTITVTVKNTVSPPPPPPTDTTPPTVSITTPVSGATISGTATITATATDNVGVTAMNLRVDDKYVSGDASSPYSFTLDTTAYADGSHTITVRGFDAAGNQTDKTITVTVKNTVLPPGTGDANGDSRMNALDLSIVLSHDGQNYPAADFNHDGTVGSADLAILLGHWTW